MPVQALLEGTKLYFFRRNGEEESRFKIIEHIGSGTFGNTYSAEDAMFGDICAIKEFAFARFLSCSAG